MDSGIYRLNFPSGAFYIGKTNDFKRRWSEHYDKLSSGKGAKKMQLEFNKTGTFKAEIILTCHPDHIDIMETYYINMLWCNEILNGIYPEPLSQEAYDYLFLDPGLLNYSTSAHCNHMVKQYKEIAELKNTLTESQEGKALLDAKNSIAQWIESWESSEAKVKELEAKLRRIKERNWFDRLFNLIY